MWLTRQPKPKPGRAGQHVSGFGPPNGGEARYPLGHCGAFVRHQFHHSKHKSLTRRPVCLSGRGVEVADELWGGVNCGTGSDAEKSSLILAHKLSTDRAFTPPVLHTLAMHSGFPHSSCTFFCVLVCFVLCRSRKAFATTHKEPCSTNGGLLFAAPTARRYSGR